MTTNKAITQVTQRIIERSSESRSNYLAQVDAYSDKGPHRSALSCSNLAHGFAACGNSDKSALAGDIEANIGIISAYNDMLSAHQPYQHFPKLLKSAAREFGGVAQVAGAVPAMCDGVTQGQPGMELSLFSRDVIAMAAAIGLSHNMFDAAIFLGICDKIVPGLVIAALTYGHIPAVFVPAGPMPSGLPNDEKAKVRQLYAEGKVGRDELLKAESSSYHSPGTCTFYGTANSNQMLMEIMGLHLPGSSFINPDTPLRDALTRQSVKQALSITNLGNSFTPIGKMIDERSFVNAIVGLHATGGSTNHTLHLIAMAKAGGIHITLKDMADLSDEVPLLARVYPNGLADVNHFHAAGGMPYLIRQLIDGGFVHRDANTIMGEGLEAYTREPKLKNGELTYDECPKKSGNPKILTDYRAPFSKTGGLKMLDGNLGKAVSKISAVKEERRSIKAPAIIFNDQHDILEAFKNGDLEKDFVAVLRFQGPQANGMPELHKMVSPLGVLQDRGFKVALITDGRMSGASGKILTAIHVTPEAVAGGNIGKIQDGDMILLDANAGKLELHISQEELAKRDCAIIDLEKNQSGLGRELFRSLRENVSGAASGATIF